MTDNASKIIDTILNSINSNQYDSEFIDLTTIMIKDFIKSNNIIDINELLDYISDIILEQEFNELSDIQKSKIINLSYLHAFLYDLINQNEFENFINFFFKGYKV